MTLYDEIYKIVSEIPFGKVMTYQGVAAKTGNPKRARIVGNALHQNPSPETIPCYRVVSNKGCVSCSFAFGGSNRQRELLLSEGVPFDKNGNVILKECIYIAK